MHAFISDIFPLILLSYTTMYVSSKLEILILCKRVTIVVEIHLGKKSRSKRATCISTDANQSAGDNEYFK